MGVCEGSNNNSVGLMVVVFHNFDMNSITNKLGEKNLILQLCGSDIFCGFRSRAARHSSHSWFLGEGFGFPGEAKWTETATPRPAPTANQLRQRPCSSYWHTLQPQEVLRLRWLPLPGVTRWPALGCTAQRFGRFVPHPAF